MKIKFTLFICLFSLTLFSQGVDNLWLMGYESWAGFPFGGINMNFSGGTLNTTYQSRAMDFNCTNSEICDKNGNLLFCSNGTYVATAQFDTMQNGGGLNPGYYTSHHAQGLTIPQANLIIPFPDDSMKYYLFHETCDDYGNTYSTLYLYYSIIDMSLDSGKGAVIQKNLILLNDSLVEGELTACKHANGRDWWLIAHQNHTNRYYKYLITPSGIQSPIMQDIGAIRWNYFGQTVFSPDGKLFSYYEGARGDLDLFDFDRCSGDLNLKAHVDINDSALGTGCAFSPNSKVLYLSSMNYVYQFDMSSANIASTQTTVAVYDGFYSPSPPYATSFYLSQLAPDGKIYINCGNSTEDIHVINYPDSLGLSCDVCQHCVHLPSFNAFTIANHPNYFLGAEGGTICDSLATLTPNIVSNEDGKLNLFPNPTTSNGDITFTYPSTGETRYIAVFNIDGKEVARYALPQWSSVHHIKLPKFASGIYLARLVSDKCTMDLKFVVE